MEVQGIPTQKHYNLTHFQQRFNWDCGLSCVLMILTSSQRQEFLENFDAICQEEGFGLSTWTIDLCYVLQRFEVHHEYLTKTLGIDPNYSQHSYYSHIIGKDDTRVNGKFKNAAAHGLLVEQRTVDMKALLRHLAMNGPIILLTNASQLTCEICKQNVLEKFGCLMYCFAPNTCTPRSYAGHYVVLCGYDLNVQKIYYRNPEVEDDHVCYCSIGSLDSARKAYGTDEDVILIFKH